MSFNAHFLRGAIFLSFFSIIAAAPNRSPVSSNVLVKRYNTLVGCSDDQAAKANQALADAANLALIAFDGASTSNLGYQTYHLIMKACTDLYRFSHYFQDSELDVFKNAMSTIAGNNDPTNPAYTFIVNCNPTGDVLKTCGKSSYVVF